jgi:hypothetical protein
MRFSFIISKNLFMKRLFFLIAILSIGTIGHLNAQDVLKKAGQALSVLPIGNIGETANGILGVLKPKLGLNETQSPKVLDLVTNFLSAKSEIIPEAKSAPASYTSKFTGIKDKLFSGLKTVLTVAQFKSLLSSKPKTNSSANLLSHLFF